VSSSRAGSLEAAVHGRRRTAQVIGDVRRRPTSLVQLDALVWGTLGRPGSRAAAVDAGVDQPSPHRLGADAVLLADVSEAEPALCVQQGELGVRRTPTPSNRGATVDAEAGETEVHETGAAAQQFADLGTAAMLIAVEPADLIVVDVAAGPTALGRRGTSAATSQLCTVWGATPNWTARAGIGWLSSTYAATSVATSGLPTARGITPSFPPTRLGGRSGRAVRDPASRAAPASSRSSDHNFPNGFGLTAATDLRQQRTPTTATSAVAPAQTWWQSEREAVRNPSRPRVARDPRGLSQINPGLCAGSPGSRPRPRA